LRLKQVNSRTWPKLVEGNLRYFNGSVEVDGSVLSVWMKRRNPWEHNNPWEFEAISVACDPSYPIRLRFDAGTPVVPYRLTSCDDKSLVNSFNIVNLKRCIFHLICYVLDEIGVIRAAQNIVNVLQKELE